MNNILKNFIKKLTHIISHEVSSNNHHQNDNFLLTMGAMLSKQQYTTQSSNINDYEFKIFSQFGDDGIIQYLIGNVEIESKVFIEFGAGNFLESNCRFLMMNNNWSGFVMDGSIDSMEHLKKLDWFWKYNLTCKAIFIDKVNINQILQNTGYSNIGLMHIDLDGNDYHILESIDFTKLNPSILILEYNSVFGDERTITVPYNDSFDRAKAHYSYLYWGASLAALNFMANKKGYRLIGSNLAGNNAYFIRKDLLNEKIRETSVKFAYKTSLFRESRNKNGVLSFVTGEERINLITGLEVLNVVSGETEKL